MELKKQNFPKKREPLFPLWSQRTVTHSPSEPNRKGMLWKLRDCYEHWDFPLDANAALYWRSCITARLVPPSRVGSVSGGEMSIKHKQQWPPSERKPVWRTALFNTSCFKESGSHARTLFHGPETTAAPFHFISTTICYTTVSLRWGPAGGETAPGTVSPPRETTPTCLFGCLLESLHPDVKWIANSWRL